MAKKLKHLKKLILARKFKYLKYSIKIGGKENSKLVQKIYDVKRNIIVGAKIQNSKIFLVKFEKIDTRNSFLARKFKKVTKDKMSFLAPKFK